MKIKVKEIQIYPLGGISKFNMPLNTKIYKEFLILIAGPLFQYIAFFILLILFPNDSNKINAYHYSILIFNLLPIYPLDGSKLLKLLLELIFPYKYSIKITLLISYIVIIIIIPIIGNINGIIMGIYLLYMTTKEYRKINQLYNKFLLERYLYSFYFKKSKIIRNDNHFYRDKRHLIKRKNTYYLENEYLTKKYRN